MKILIVEDNQIISDNIKKYLALQSIESTQVFSWKDIWYHLSNTHYDVIILDIWLWESDGVEICKDIREKWNNIPILMLTARATTKDTIIWLDAWADDYMTKPFDYEELIARIKTLIRRNYSLKWSTLKIKNIDIHEDKREVFIGKKHIELSKLEFDLFLYLAKNKWKTITKEELFEKVWGEYDDFIQSRSVDLYVSYLRKKLWKDIIETKRGLWYVIP